MSLPLLCLFFFFTETTTTELYTLSLHDALPICARRDRHGPAFAGRGFFVRPRWCLQPGARRIVFAARDRKSTRLNSSHQIISYAVFCLQKKTLPEGNN